MCFKNKAQANEAATPHPIEDMANLVNSRTTFNIVCAENFSVEPVYLNTVLNKMIETASFVIPSPNTIENYFGSFLKLIKDTSATTSEEHIKEHNNKISLKVRVNTSDSPDPGTNLVIG